MSQDRRRPALDTTPPPESRRLARGEWAGVVNRGLDVVSPSDGPRRRRRPAPRRSRTREATGLLAAFAVASAGLFALEYWGVSDAVDVDESLVAAPAPEPTPPGRGLTFLNYEVTDAPDGGGASTRLDIAPVTPAPALAAPRTPPKPPVDVVLPGPVVPPVARRSETVAAAAPSEPAPRSRPTGVVPPVPLPKPVDPRAAAGPFAAGPERRVFVHYDDARASGVGEAGAVARDITLIGLPVADLRPVDGPIGAMRLRYFHEADRRPTEELARRLEIALTGGVTGLTAIQDFTHYAPRPRPGTIEVWLPSPAGG